VEVGGEDLVMVVGTMEWWLTGDQGWVTAGSRWAKRWPVENWGKIMIGCRQLSGS
jgi:hypothetical protein